MVWATILAATVIGQRSLWTADAPYRSRAEFHALAAPFKHGSRIEDVIRALGKPDRIQKRHGVLVSEVLDYGIEPMSKVATLGTFVFEEGKLTYDHSGPITSDYFDRTKPYVQIIPEAELRQILGQICEEPPQWLLNDALRILHLTNILAALGDAKAKYALGESERLHPHIISFQYPDLLQTLFADPNVAQDLPIVLHWSLAEFLIGGKPTTLHSYRAKSIRTDLIHPPTDPFSVLWNELRKNNTHGSIRRLLHGRLVETSEDSHPTVRYSGIRLWQ